MRMTNGLTLTMVLAFAFIAIAQARAQQAYVYPMKGQSQEQQNRDKGECTKWAAQQTGYNPYQAGPGMPQRGGVLRGAAGGAALGAVGGAIGGDAGKGAAIGAGVGALFGGVRMRREREQEAYQAQQANAAYTRAFGACMQGRGYAVN